jgi:hypothetical protein
MTTNPLDPGASADSDRLDPRVDLVVALVVFLVGAAIVWQSWSMPTFRERQGDIFTAPGIVPGFYGCMIAGLAVLLGGRALGRRRRSLGATTPGSLGQGLSGLALVAAFCLVFALGLVTRLPFWMAATLFVSSFVLVFEWPRNGGAPARWRCAAIAAVTGLGAGLGIALVFERVFLVRLP